MRSFWSKIPMVRVLPCFIAGVLAEMWLDGGSMLGPACLWPAGILLLMCLLAIIIYGRLGTLGQYKWKAVNGMALATVIAALAFILTWFYTDRHAPDYFANSLSDVTYLKAKVIQPPLEKEKFINIIAEVQETRSAKGNFNTSGKILINVLRGDSAQPLNYGDVIGFWAKIDTLKGPTNPGEFNYSRYQHFHNLYHSTFITEGGWTVAETGKGSPLMARVFKMRAYFLKLVSAQVKDTADFGVASAIMLGYNQYMSRDVMKAYTTSGVLHVLSVSGLHVGIVFLMLNFILSWMDTRGRNWVIAKAVVIILFIWYYACLTGLSPSVLRAAAMFSMIQTGRVAIRHVNIYNILAASALVLMLFNPFIITEAGFLLSYLAVAGIVYLYPKVAGLLLIGGNRKAKYKGVEWYLKPFYFLRYDLQWFFLSWLPDFFWQMTAVSIAAQIATLPLSLYYFHQFPVLALVTNLVVIPLSNLALFAGTALFLLAKVPVLGHWAGWVFSHFIHWLNRFVFWFDALPFALIKNISISLAEALLLYGVIILWAWLTEKARPRVLIASLLLILAIGIISAYRLIGWQQQRLLAVYDISRQKAVAVINGRNAQTDFDSTLVLNERQQSFHIQPHWIACGISSVEPLPKISMPVGQCALYNGSKILIVDTVIERPVAPGKKLDVQLVILSHSAAITLAQLSRFYSFNQVVFDASNRPKRVARWIEECGALKISYWNVKERGAYIKNLR